VAATRKGVATRCQCVRGQRILNPSQKADTNNRQMVQHCGGGGQCLQLTTCKKTSLVDHTRARACHTLAKAIWEASAVGQESRPNCASNIAPYLSFLKLPSARIKLETTTSCALGTADNARTTLAPKQWQASLAMPPPGSRNK